MVATVVIGCCNAQAEESLRREIIPLATIVTPNLAETEVLVGRKVASLEETCGLLPGQIVADGARAVVVKGGHAITKATDVFYDGSSMELVAERGGRDA